MRWRDWREAGAQSAIITVALTAAEDEDEVFGADEDAPAIEEAADDEPPFEADTVIEPSDALPKAA